MNRLTEECEKLKAAAKDASLQARYKREAEGTPEERDRVSSDRKDVERLTNEAPLELLWNSFGRRLKTSWEVRKLERQRTELVGRKESRISVVSGGGL